MSWPSTKPASPQTGGGGGGGCGRAGLVAHVNYKMSQTTADGVLHIQYRRKSRCRHFDESRAKFAILPYIEGQKYTIGDVFTSRDEQGEFIFWTRSKINLKSDEEEEDQDGEDTENCKDDMTMRKLPMCEITCSKKNYWVTPLGGDTISINNVEVNEKSRLKFGDELSIGGLVECCSCQGRRTGFHDYEKSACSGVLQFKKRILESTRTPGRPRKLDGVNSALTNVVIVSNILSYASTEDLTTVRLVSKLWNEEAVKFMKKKCSVTFFLLPWPYSIYSFGKCETSHHTNETMKIFRYCHEMRNTPLANWSMVLPEVHNMKKDTESGKPLDQGVFKLIEDLNMLLECQGQNVKTLTAGYGEPIICNSENVFKFLKKYMAMEEHAQDSDA